MVRISRLNERGLKSIVKGSAIALLVLGLVCLNSQVMAIQIAAPLPQTYAFKDDVLEFSIASYYKGANQSLSFTSDQQGLTVVPPFSYGTDISVPEGDCNNTVVVQNGSLDQVFGLCAAGTKIIKHSIDQETFKEETAPQVLTLQTELKYPVKCFDMLSGPIQAKMVILCRRTDTNLLVLVELGVSDFKISASSDIKLEKDQLDLKKPGFAVDFSPADESLDYEVVIFDTQPEEFTTSVRWVQRNSKTNPSTYITGPFFGQKVNEPSGNNFKLPDQLNSFKIQDVFVRDRKLFVLASMGQAAEASWKSSKCELELVERQWGLKCSEFHEIFTNTAAKSLVDIAFSQDVYYSSDEEIEIVLTYIEAQRFDKKNIYFPSLKAVRPVEKLFFKSALDMEAKTPVIGVVGREVVIHATSDDGKTFLLHWKIEREYLSIVPSTNLKFKSLVARPAPTDRRKFEVVYLSDNNPTILNYFRVQGTVFRITPSDPYFQTQGKSQTTLTFSVTDGEKTLNPWIDLKILKELDQDATLTMNEAYDMYPGTQASIPVSSDRISGNGASFSVSTNVNNATASVKYAEAISTVTLPKFDTGLDVAITYAKNVGGNTYLVSAGNNLKAFECALAEDKLSCKKLFENQQEGDFKIIDAKKHDDCVYILFSKTVGSEPKVALMKLLLEDGSRASDVVYYDTLLGMGALGAIRIFNQDVYLDIIARTAQEPNKFKIFICKFSSRQGPKSAELEPRTSLPLHICPKNMVWSPRKEPYLFIESICENGKKEVLEFSENYQDVSTFTLAKIYPLTANSINEMCITSAAIVIVDYESSEIFGLVRGPSQDTKISFPLKHLGFNSVKTLSCSRYNNFFQVVATNTAENKEYLVTYRTNAINQPNKRIHSIIELKGRQASQNSKQWVLPSVNPSDQEIFTLAMGAKWSDPVLATVVELDVPRIKLNLKNYILSNGEVEVTVKQNILKAAKPVESKFTVKVREISNNLNLVPRVADQNKIAFQKGQRSLSLDDNFYIDGLVLNQTLTGDSDTVKKFKLTPRVSINQGKYLGFPKAAKDCRQSQFGVLFCWDATHVYVWEKDMKEPTSIPVFVSNADVIQGFWTPGQASTNYTFLTGLNQKPGDAEDYLFVISKVEGVWRYYFIEVNDGLTWMRSHLIEAVQNDPKFAFIGHNPETDSIEAGLYRLKRSTEQQKEKFEVVIDRNRTVKVFTDKISHVQSLYLGQTLQVIYHPRNTREFMMLGLNKEDLRTMFEEKVDFGSRASTDSYAEGQLKCSASYSQKKVMPPNPSQDNDMKFFCSMTTQRFGSVAASFQLDQTNKNNPKLVDAGVIPNIPGFYPVGLRINHGYTAILKRAIPDYTQSLIPKYLVNETIIVHVLSNSDRTSHAVVAGSAFWNETTAALVADTEFGVDIGFENNNTVLILAGGDEKFGVFSAHLNPLTLEIKNEDADIKKVKLSIKGLETTQDVELANHVDYDGYGYLRIVMIGVGAAFLTLILCALSFLCTSRDKSTSDIHDKEVTFIDEMDRSRFSGAYSASSGSTPKQSA